MTGLSMRTLFEAHEQTILVAEGIANIRGSRASIMTAGDPLALIFQKLTRRRFRFADAMLAKIAAAEAQMARERERIAELEDYAARWRLVDDAVQGAVRADASYQALVGRGDASETEKMDAWRRVWDARQTVTLEVYAAGILGRAGE